MTITTITVSPSKPITIELKPKDSKKGFFFSVQKFFGFASSHCKIVPLDQSEKIKKVQNLISSKFPTVLLHEVVKFLTAKEFVSLSSTCKLGSLLDRNLLLWKYIAFNEELNEEDISRYKSGKNACISTKLLDFIDFCQLLPNSRKFIEKANKSTSKLPMLKIALQKEMKKDLSYQDLTRIDLPKLTLKIIPSGIYFPSNLTSLNLSGNDLTQLTESICELKKLTLLYIVNNRIKKLPNSIGKLTSLTELNACNNHLKSLPSSFDMLKNLNFLRLEKNSFAEVPSCIENLNRLEWLDLRRNNITQFPVWLGKLPSLLTLQLANNKLNSLPSDLMPFTSLRNLELAGNNLKELPPWISLLPRVHITVDKNLLPKKIAWKTIVSEDPSELMVIHIP